MTGRKPDRTRRQDESASRFRALAEESIQGVLVHRDHEILFANQALVDILGYASVEEALAVRDVLAFVHPDERERLARYRRDRMAGRPVPSRYEFRALAKDGSTVWIENIVRAVDWEGGPAIQSFMVDITERKRAESALRESEARFRDLVEGSIQGVVVHRDFRPLFANKALADMLGYESSDELLALASVLDFVHPEERGRMTELKDRRLVGRRAPTHYEMRAIRRDGSEIWLENVARVVDWGGQTAIQATFIDITERKRTEESLRRSEESFRNAQRIARIGNWDWYIEGGVLRWSDEIYRIFGVEPRAFPATYEAFLAYVHPDDRDLVETAVSSALAGHAPYWTEHRIVLADGTVRVVHEQGEVHRDDSGRPIRMSGTVQDITDLRRTEEALRESEASLRNAQRIARIGSWDRDIASGTLRWSDQMFELFGMDPEGDTPSPESFLRRVHPDDRPQVRKAATDALAGRAAYDMDFRIRLPGGEQRTIHAQGEVVRDGAGNPLNFLGTAQDVTLLRAAEAKARRLAEELEDRVEQRTRELREAQGELIKKDRLATLGQLTATVSHELRNPLGAMRTSIYVLAQRIDMGDERAHRAIERVERSIARCDRIIDELLDFTRAREIDRRPVDFDRWLGELLDEMSIPDGVEIVRDFDGPRSEVLIDADRMRRVVINLVDNAVQAMAEQQHAAVTVSTCVAGDNLHMRVADTGPGIPETVLPNVFEPLFSTKSFGVGLGLPTVRHIAEQHNGSVVVEKTGPTGTVFRLSFPLRCPASADGSGEYGTIHRK